MGVTVLSGILTKEDYIQGGRENWTTDTKNIGWAVVWNHSSMRPVQETGDPEMSLNFSLQNAYDYRFHHFTAFQLWSSLKMLHVTRKYLEYPVLPPRTSRVA